MLFIVLLCPLKWEVSAWESTSQSWMTSGHHVFSSLVATRCCVCSLRSDCWLLLRLRGPALFIYGIWTCIAIQVPCVVHHLHEIHVVVNACWNVCVVLNELISCNRMIAWCVIHQVVMSLKSLQELSKDLLWSLSPFNDSRVLLSIVDSDEILHFNNSVSVPVKLLESSDYYRLAIVVQVSSDHS